MGSRALLPALQSVDHLLNLLWVLLAAAALIHRAQGRMAAVPPRALVALLCILVLLLPVISITDDLAEQAQVYDVGASPASFGSAKHIKASPAPHASLAAAVAFALQPWRESVLDRLHAPKTAMAALALAASSTGIHSPPISL